MPTVPHPPALQNRPRALSMGKGMKTALLLPRGWLWDASFNNKVRLRCCVGFVLLVFVCIFKIGPEARAPQNCLKRNITDRPCVQRGKLQKGKAVWYLWIMVRETLLRQTFPLEQGKEIWSKVERNFLETSAPDLPFYRKCDAECIKCKEEGVIEKQFSYPFS